MKRVFHIISKFDLGGAERVAANIAKSGNDDFEYHVVEVLRGDSSFTHGFSMNCSLSALPVTGLSCPLSIFISSPNVSPPCSFLFAFWCSGSDTDPMWCMPIPKCRICACGQSRASSMELRRVKLVRTIHNTCLWTGLKRFGRKVERFYQRHDANVAISQSVLDCYTREYGSQPPIIYNGVPEVEQKAYDGLKAGKTNILFAGRFDDQKGIVHLVAVIKGLQDMPQYHFL